MSTLLAVENLTKHYGELKAVAGISFKIPKGICFGLLGPNGAGKTTTIEMIEGITHPTSGEILYKNKPRGKDFKLEVGIQFQSTALMEFITVAEVLELFARLYPKTANLDDLIEVCQLKNFINQHAAKLSGGQRQRLLLAVALINDPEIVFLDEPTTGLDPQSRRRFWDLVETIKAQGKTIVLTTHYMDEAEYLCDHLLIIDQGHIIAEGSPEQLLGQHFDHSFVLLNREELPESFASKHPISYQGDQAIIKTLSVEETLKELIEQKITLNSLRVRNPTLDDLFLKLAGHSLRE